MPQFALTAFDLDTGLTNLSFSNPLLEAAVAERDARPTSSEMSNAVAESRSRGQQDVIDDPETYSLYNESELTDARVGSTIIEVSGGQVAITVTLEETSDLTDWSNATTSEKIIEVDAPAGTRFYRFKMTE